MALSELDLDTLAATLVEQREAGTNIAFPEDLTPDRDEIYAVQDRVTRLLGNGVDPMLFKVSWLPPVLVDSPDQQPCFAGIPAGRVYDNDTTIDQAGHVRRLGFEIEIACRLVVDATGVPTPSDAIFGIEVLEEHSDDVNKQTIRGLLAAGMFNHGYVLGPEIAGWPDLKAMPVRVWRNDTLILETTVGEEFDPDVRLAAFLAHAKSVGWPVSNGMIVSLGALNKDVWGDPGDRFTGEIDGFGKVSAAIG